jgi:hypothetical protein
MMVRTDTKGTWARNSYRKWVVEPKKCGQVGEIQAVPAGKVGSIVTLWPQDLHLAAFNQ